VYRVANIRMGADACAMLVILACLLQQEREVVGTDRDRRTVALEDTGARFAKWHVTTRLIPVHSWRRVSTHDRWQRISMRIARHDR
jgi:hypothetical protein